MCTLGADVLTASILGVDLHDFNGPPPWTRQQMRGRTKAYRNEGSPVVVALGALMQDFRSSASSKVPESRRLVGSSSWRSRFQPPPEKMEARQLLISVLPSVMMLIGCGGLVSGML